MSSNNNNRISQVEIKLWEILDFFHSIGLKKEEYFVVLFILSVYHKRFDFNLKIKDNLLKDLNSNYFKFNNSSQSRFNDIYLDSWGYDQIRKLFDVFNPVLEKIGEEGIRNLGNILNSIDIKDLDTSFPEIFDKLLYKVSKLQGRFGGEYMMPQELCQFMCSLAKLPKNAKVYNPFAGLASFRVFLDENYEYLGQEINQTTWAIGSLRIMAHEKGSNSKYILGDSIIDWNPTRINNVITLKDISKSALEKEKFDLILSQPPFGMKVPKYIDEKFGGNRTFEHFLIKNGLEALNPDGKMVICVPQGVLFRSGIERNLRHDLIEEDSLEMVISLPAGLLMNTGLSVAILVLNKNKKDKGKVSFIDASKFIKSSSKEKKLNVKALNDAIRYSTDPDIIKIVSNEEVAVNDFNLNVPLYFRKKHKGVSLVDLGSIIKGKRVIEAQTGKFIRIRDLKDDKLGSNLELQAIGDTEIPYHALKIEESCLLMAIRWKSLRPTFFKYTGTPIYLTTDTIAFKVDESKIAVDYLINELYSDYVTEQIESIRFGVTIPTIKRNDLLSLKIILPSIEEQLAKLSGLKESMVRMKILEAERNALAHGLGNLVYENFASVKHSLGKPLLNIGSSLRNIEKALAKLDIDLESIKLSERLEVTLKDSFDSIYSNLDFIHSLLKNNEKDFDVDKYELSDIDFLKFIKAYVRKVRSSSERHNIKFNLDINPDLVKYFRTKPYIYSNTDLLEIALNNIIDNANRHAFVDPSQNYILEIRLSLKIGPTEKNNSSETLGRFSLFMKIEVANNGNPFPQNFTLDKFIRKNTFAGKTGNTGRGGFDINEIVKRLNDGRSTLDLVIADTATEFVTTVTFLIPLTS